MAHQGQIEEMFEALVEALRGELEGFGRRLACDSKGIETHARMQGRKVQEALEPDGRRDVDADVGKKTYRGWRRNNSSWWNEAPA